MKKLGNVCHYKYSNYIKDLISNQEELIDGNINLKNRISELEKKIKQLEIIINNFGMGD